MTVFLFRDKIYIWRAPACSGATRRLASDGVASLQALKIPWSTPFCVLDRMGERDNVV